MSGKEGKDVEENFIWEIGTKVQAVQPYGHTNPDDIEYTKFVALNGRDCEA